MNVFEVGPRITAIYVPDTKEANKLTTVSTTPKIQCQEATISSAQSTFLTALEPQKMHTQNEYMATWIRNNMQEKGGPLSRLCSTKKDKTSYDTIWPYKLVISLLRDDMLK